jgi:hypothetical protein
MPRKILVNRRYGGFGLSELVITMYKEARPEKIGEHWYANMDIERDDPELIRIVEKIGLDEAGGLYSSLKIIEIPDDVPADGWIVQDYDGMEWIAEKHRTWC